MYFNSGIIGLFYLTSNELVICGYPIYLLHPFFLPSTENMNGLFSILRALLIYGICVLISCVLYRIPIARMLFVNGKQRKELYVEKQDIGHNTCI